MMLKHASCYVFHTDRVWRPKLSEAAFLRTLLWLLTDSEGARFAINPKPYTLHASARVTSEAQKLEIRAI